MFTAYELRNLTKPSIMQGAEGSLQNCSLSLLRDELIDSNSSWISPSSFTESSPSSNSNSTAILTPIEKEGLLAQPALKKLRHLSQQENDSQSKSVIKAVDAIADEVSAVCTVQQIGGTTPTSNSNFDSKSGPFR